ncbi:flagellar motor protein MotB [Deferribacter autotrophicus]|uniref:Flagellar motor protein MotB n=1 Tax=Deferribacter autotrophicus TaxID=500465 RepID=A0A5A8F6H8_9BACT|nr:OmpA family protein [Deferribacter autotrophicus]KAA0258419.1 flagellar motor protein MotB [Deferribacter autotrophicus]
MAEKKCEECKAGAPEWMVTFSDMTTLLLTFFVLLLSMASLDQRKIKEALGSLQGALGVLEAGRKSEIGKEEILSRMDFVQQIKKTEQQMLAGLRNYVEQANLSSQISVVKTDKGISVRIMDSVLFEPGSADILPSAIPILEKLAAVMRDTPYNILVEGHTDDIPIHTPKFPSNWELSTARAVAIVKFFIRKGVKPEKLSAAGYAQYHPIVPNITPENRAKNRRVEINFVSPELAESSKNIFEENNSGGF